MSARKTSEDTIGPFETWVGDQWGPLAVYDSGIDGAARYLRADLTCRECQFFIREGFRCHRWEHHLKGGDEHPACMNIIPRVKA